uniref:Solute carrier family 40 protein n=1 Tax=Angiostrongylus cantonensis TaxID=6313 RepID=A0A0K0DJ38_ANGCA
MYLPLPFIILPDSSALVANLVVLHEKFSGFLSGFTVSEAVFAFNFANESLLYSYRWISLPIHFVFLICFTIGCVAAIDSIADFKKALSHSGLIGIVLWSIGILATSACIRFDETIAPANVNHIYHTVRVQKHFSVSLFTSV